MTRKILVLVAVMMMWASVASAHFNLQNEVGVDRFAHAGVSYIIADQLHRNAGFNRFWAGFTTLAIGAAKELWVDNNWDNGDFAADCAGVLMYQIEF